MHKYFLIPIIFFFLIICLCVFYLQYINNDWKFRIISEKKEVLIPDICDDENNIKIISHPNDHIDGRSFKDNTDISSNFQLHAIYLLPCEVKDRKFDVNKNIHFSLETINKWFLKNQKNKLLIMTEQIKIILIQLF